MDLRVREDDLKDAGSDVGMYRLVVLVVAQGFYWYLYVCAGGVVGDFDECCRIDGECISRGINLDQSEEEMRRCAAQ